MPGLQGAGYALVENKTNPYSCFRNEPLCVEQIILLFSDQLQRWFNWVPLINTHYLGLR